jgi:protein-disulfide isomerase
MPRSRTVERLRAQLTLLFLWLAVPACAPGCTPPPADPGSESRGPRPGGPAAVGDTEAPMPPPAEMITVAKGVDLSKLTEAQRTAFFQLINLEPSACDKPHSLATSLRDDDKCRDSLIVAQFIADRMAAGIAVSDVRIELDEVRDALRVREIDIAGRPAIGNERAPVTVVVFADFECPHCKAEAPGLRQAVQQFRGQAKLVFKHYPLNMHARAKVAAVACEVAHAQGKFWEMHDQVFAHQEQLEDADLRRYAQKIGLDLARFDADFQARRGEAAVDRDRAEGEKLGISGTPTVYVNGRMFNPMLFGGTVAGWIDDALRR